MHVGNPNNTRARIVHAVDPRRNGAYASTTNSTRAATAQSPQVTVRLLRLIETCNTLASAWPLTHWLPWPKRAAAGCLTAMRVVDVSYRHVETNGCQEDIH